MWQSRQSTCRLLGSFVPPRWSSLTWWTSSAPAFPHFPHRRPCSAKAFCRMLLPLQLGRGGFMVSAHASTLGLGGGDTIQSCGLGSSCIETHSRLGHGPHRADVAPPSYKQNWRVSFVIKKPSFDIVATEL